MKIITKFVKPPVPTKLYDWVAFPEGEEEAGPYGRGPTEAEALRDLASQLAGLWFSRQEKA